MKDNSLWVPVPPQGWCLRILRQQHCSHPSKRHVQMFIVNTVPDLFRRLLAREKVGNGIGFSFRRCVFVEGDESCGANDGVYPPLGGEP